MSCLAWGLDVGVISLHVSQMLARTQQTLGFEELPLGLPFGSMTMIHLALLSWWMQVMFYCMSLWCVRCREEAQEVVLLYLSIHRYGQSVCDWFNGL